MRILVTAGPTREAIDAVRFLSNKSTGRMGYALAEAAVAAGHDVVLVSGPVALTPPDGLLEFVPVVSAADMADAVKRRAPDCGMVIMCAAVADYTPAHPVDRKMKKSDGNLTLELKRTEDILKTLGQNKPAGQILIGFAAETDDLEQYARSKLAAKNLDWIAANDVSRPDRGFAAGTNAVALFAADGRRFDIPLQSKDAVARRMLGILLPPSGR
ncbi:MAG: phosphopantothenoylcysteine decarboxylase [Lentisphaeria bacterium]|nr:phosphopantothenoylcysteine decarboxylase [Lentisphaeria bacterium]